MTHKPNVIGQLGLSGLQKCTTTMRTLAYDIVSNATDEYVQLASSTSMLALKRFALAISVVYESTYLRLLCLFKNSIRFLLNKIKWACQEIFYEDLLSTFCNIVSNHTHVGVNYKFPFDAHKSSMKPFLSI